MKLLFKVLIIIILSLLFAGILFGLFYGLADMENNNQRSLSCIELFPLDSCELYNCRANYSNTISNKEFNLRNYEICKIIINNNMSFNESIKLMEIVEYE